MRPVFLLAGALIGLGAIAPASAADLVYKPYSLLGSGYRDHVTSEGEWATWGHSRQLDGGRILALYRAAELADAEGVTAIRIVDQSITVESRRSDGGVLDETASFTVRPVRSPADLQICKMRHKERCLTLSVAKVMAAYGPRLDQAATPRTPGSAAASMAYGAPASEAQVALLKFFAQRQAAAAAQAEKAYRPSPLPLLSAPQTSQVTAVPVADPYEAGRQAARAALASSGTP